MAPGFSFPPPPPPPPKAASQDYASGQDSRGGLRGGRGGRGGGRGRGGAPFQGGYQQPNYGGPQMNNLPGGAYINPAFQHNQTGYDRNTGADYGQKRKRDDHSTERSAGSWRSDQRQYQPSRPHPMSKPEIKPKVNVAPAVPSFGAPLFQPPPPARGSAAGSSNTPGQQPKTRLGLVPRGDEEDVASSESEEDDNLDEEAAFQASSTGPMTFEYNGEVAKLETQADIKAWIEERKKSWPSRRKIDEKQAEVQARMEERRRIEEETRVATTYGSRTNGQRQIHQHKSTQQSQSEDPRDVDSKTVSAPSIQTETEHGQTAQQSDVEQDGPSQKAEAQSDDDSAPEEVSSRVTPYAVVPDVSAKICNTFAATGRCKFGKKCRYQHVRPIGAPEPASRSGQDRTADSTPKRKTLFDRMVEQEDDESDLLALQAIKYLGNLGFFRQNAGDN
ncbi:hypothetical protein MBLNU457_g0709t1 [Dothideomycetes sp. NU457]